MITNMIGQKHDPLKPGFTLIPIHRGVGWAVYVPDVEMASELAGRIAPASLYDRPVTVACGPLHKIKNPKPAKRGRQLVRVDAITPIHLRTDHSKRTHLFPTAGNLHSTLSAWLPRRLGVEIDPDDVCLVLKHRETQVDRVDMGGKYGVAVGFTGHVVLEVNAVTAWLLKCAETLGLGGKTAFGFGRVRVSDAGE